MVDGWGRADSIGDVEYSKKEEVDSGGISPRATSITCSYKVCVGPERWWALGGGDRAGAKYGRWVG